VGGFVGHTSFPSYRGPSKEIKGGTSNGKTISKKVSGVSCNIFGKNSIVYIIMGEATRERLVSEPKRKRGSFMVRSQNERLRNRKFGRTSWQGAHLKKKMEKSVEKIKSSWGAVSHQYSRIPVSATVWGLGKDKEKTWKGPRGKG